MASVRALGVLLGIGVAIAPTSALAGKLEARPIERLRGDDHPLFRLVEQERASETTVRDVIAPPPGFGASSTRSALDCVHAKHDIAVDPRTGVTTATLDLVVRASNKPLAAIAFLFDEGLRVTSTAADGRTASASDLVHGPQRVVRVDLSPALAAGDTTTLHVAYGGTLTCGSFPNSGAVACTKGGDFSFFPHQSIFPYLFDPIDSNDATIDSLTRDIVLRVPSDVDVVATGEKVDDTTSGGTRVSSWTIDRPLARGLGLYVLAGKLGSRLIGDRSVPTTLVFPAPEEGVDQRLASWSSPVLSWVERLTGGALPFQRSLTLVRLPADLGDPGTATYGMTLLSESYARAGDVMHEETWAHENTHLFWGIVVPETNMQESRLMSEGMATLSEIDYTHARHFASEDRDTYLARRFVPIAMDLRVAGKDLPPVLLRPGDWLGETYGTPAYTMWAYHKTAAVLDHLRVTIGEEAFSRALAAYVAQCSYVGCSPEDFRGVLERTTGKDLGAFFDRWVTASTRPTVTIAFTPDAGGASVSLTKADEQPMTLELWARLEDGQLVKRRVDLGGRTTIAAFDAASPVRSLSPSPRHDVLVDVQSVVTGDLDFDGETDGFDLLRCTRLVGVAHATKGPGTGLWNVDEQFDPRCDRNGDQRIDEDDVLDIAKTFGILRDP